MPGGRGKRSGRGGNQPPAKPAAVSGPGALSQRTDGGPGQPLRAPGGQDYGARKATLDQQRAAPLATGGAPPVPAAPPAPAPAGAAAAAVPGVGGLPDPFGPSQRPDEPVTAGMVPVGAPDPAAVEDGDLQALLPYLPALEIMVSQPGSSVSARNFVRRLRAMSVPAPGPVIPPLL